MINQIPIIWRLRSHALQPVAVAAFGVAAQTLAQRCLARDDAALSLLRGVEFKLAVSQTQNESNRYGIIISGDCASLPWADGAFYLGRDAQAPSVLLPTTHEPDVPPALFESALKRQIAAASDSLLPPLAILPTQRCVVSLAASRPLDRARLQEWLRSCFPAEDVDVALQNEFSKKDLASTGEAT